MSLVIFGSRFSKARSRAGGGPAFEYLRFVEV